MIDLYASSSPNVLKIYIALEELALPYREIFVDVWKGDQFSATFSALNANCKVPVIVDPDVQGRGPLTVFESGAILIYLAEKCRCLLSNAEPARSETLQWLMVQVAGIGPAFGNFIHFTRFASEGNAYSVSRYRTEALRLYSVVEDRLSQSRFLSGIEYGIADIATFPWMRTLNDAGLPLSGYPRLAAWVDTIAHRPAVERAVRKIMQIKTSRADATPADLDRFFGRGAYAR